MRRRSPVRRACRLVSLSGLVVCDPPDRSSRRNLPRCATSMRRAAGIRLGEAIWAQRCVKRCGLNGDRSCRSVGLFAYRPSPSARCRKNRADACPTVSCGNTPSRIFSRAEFHGNCPFMRKYHSTDPWLKKAGYFWETTMEVTLHSVITCPHCGAKSEEVMPTDACVYFYECQGCRKLLKPTPGDCCVFCSFGTVKCPPVQLDKDCCKVRGANDV